MKTIYESGPLMKLLGQQRPPTADELTAIREIIAAHAASPRFRGAVDLLDFGMDVFRVGFICGQRAERARRNKKG